MFVMAAVNRVDENLCVIERLNNGKTQANISSQKQNKITSYMRHTSQWVQIPGGYRGYTPPRICQEGLNIA